MSEAARLHVTVSASTGSAQRQIMGVHKSMLAARGSALGLVSSLAGSAGLGFAVKKTVGTIAGFEKQMSGVKAVTQANARQMKALSGAAINMGSKTGMGARNAAKGITELAKGGVALDKIIKGGLKGTLALAAAGQMDVAEAASTTANALNLFSLKGSQASHVADALATAANTTTADVKDFAMALTQGGGAAKAAGLSFDETVVALEALAMSGYKNSDAGTSLKNALIKLAAPTKEAAALSKELGLNFFDATGSMKPLPAVADMLRDKLGKLSDQERLANLETLAGTDGLRALLALYDQGGPAIEKLGQGLKKQGEAARVAKDQTDNLAGGWSRIKAAMESLVISEGGGLAKPLKEAAFAAADFIDALRTGKGRAGEFAAAAKTAFADIKTEASNAASEIGDIFTQIQEGAQRNGKIKIDAGSAGSDFKKIAGDIKSVIAASGALGSLGQVISGAFGAATGAAGAFADVLRGDLNGAWNSLKSSASSAASLMVAPFQSALGAASKLIGPLDNVTGAFKTIGKTAAGIVGNVTQPFSAMAGAAQSSVGSINSVTGAINSAANAINKIPSSKTFTLHLGVAGSINVPRGPSVNIGGSPGGSPSGGSGNSQSPGGARRASIATASAASSKNKPVEGVNPRTGNIERRTPAQWRKLGVKTRSRKAKQQLAKARKRRNEKLFQSGFDVFGHRASDANLGVEEAAGTPDLQDDIGALGALNELRANRVKSLRKTLKTKKLSGGQKQQVVDQIASLLSDSRGTKDEIAELMASPARAMEEAARAAQEAAQAQKEAAAAAMEARLVGHDAALVQAMVNSPDDKSDDAVALHSKLDTAQQAYLAAIASGDQQGIVTFGQMILGLRDDIKGLDETIQETNDLTQQQLDIEKERNRQLQATLASSQAELRAFGKWAAGMVNNQIGARVGRAASTPRPGAFAAR